MLITKQTKYCVNHSINGKKWAKSLKKLSGPIDLVVDGAGGDSINEIFKIMRNGGKFVSYGSTAGLPKSLIVPILFLKQLQLIGSTMGSDK